MNPSKEAIAAAEDVLDNLGITPTLKSRAITREIILAAIQKAHIAFLEWQDKERMETLAAQPQGFFAGEVSITPEDQIKCYYCEKGFPLNKYGDHIPTQRLGMIPVTPCANKSASSEPINWDTHYKDEFGVVHVHKPIGWHPSSEPHEQWTPESVKALVGYDIGGSGVIARAHNAALAAAEQSGFKRGLTFYERNQKTGEILVRYDEERG
jgi:hypothetical protein